VDTVGMQPTIYYYPSFKMHPIL